MDNEIFKVMSKAKDIYIETLEKSVASLHLPFISSDEGYQILHYSEGYYFKEHCDNSGGMSRILTCTLNISDDHDGGLFRFLRGEFDVRLNAGDAVLFPSNFHVPARSHRDHARRASCHCDLVPLTTVAAEVQSEVLLGMPKNGS
jgi:ectoine hydroxylase-related dioxygenase (phytanoyl-CoA dioxygenase family)